MNNYINVAYSPGIDKNIIDHVKEGCGVRSIARLLHISANTVISRIKSIAGKIRKPAIITGGSYEVDELKTYVKTKVNDVWVIYALDRQSRQVVEFKVGRRIKTNLQIVISTLLISNCNAIYTDGSNIYKYLIPETLRKFKRYGINHIERKNLSLRTPLKRLNRKTICYPKNMQMLEAS